MPLIPAPITSADPDFVVIYKPPSRSKAHDFGKFLLLEHQKRGRLFRASAGLVVKRRLSAVRHGSKKLGQSNVIRACIGALAASHTGRTHVHQAGDMIKN